MNKLASHNTNRPKTSTVGYTRTSLLRVCVPERTGFYSIGPSRPKNGYYNTGLPTNGLRGPYEFLYALTNTAT